MQVFLYVVEIVAFLAACFFAVFGVYCLVSEARERADRRRAERLLKRWGRRGR